MKALILAFALLAFAGCAQQPEQPEVRRPQQAGQPLDPLETAARLAAVRGAALTGDQEAVRRNMDGLQEDFRKAIKLADPARAVDRESARVAAKSVAGVRSVVWLDHANLFAVVVSNERRSYATIDAICLELEPLGDTLGVVVNLQSGAATNSDELEILSRNCQLPPGDRAFMQGTRQVDVVRPELRAQHRRAKAALEESARGRGAEAAESARIIEASTPEM